MSLDPRWRCELLVLQPTPFCNIDCDYCYLADRSNKQKLDGETLRRTCERLFESGLARGPLTITWHAGEPLVLSRAYYDEAFAVVEAMRPRDVTVTHSFQTNGTLVDDAWAGFLRERGCNVGVSLDGPAPLHDLHRKTRSGGGTHERTMRGVRALAAAGVPLHVITVLTGDALEYPDELFDFYVGNGIRSVCFNVEEQEDAHPRSSLAGEGVEARYRRFLRRFLQRIDEQEEPLWVREFAGAFGRLVRGPGGAGGNQQTSPFSIISVDHRGDFALFSPELLGVRGGPYGDFSLGNVHRDRFADVVGTAKFQEMYRDVLGGCEACRAGCDYFDHCGGGAPANKYFENGTFRSTETLFCRLGKKAVLDVLLEHMERRAARGPGGSAGTGTAP